MFPRRMSLLEVRMSFQADIKVILVDVALVGELCRLGRDSSKSMYCFFFTRDV